MFKWLFGKKKYAVLVRSDKELVIKRFYPINGDQEIKGYCVVAGSKVSLWANGKVGSSYVFASWFLHEE